MAQHQSGMSQTPCGSRQVRHAWITHVLVLLTCFRAWNPILVPLQGHDSCTHQLSANQVMHMHTVSAVHLKCNGASCCCSAVLSRKPCSAAGTHLAKLVSHLSHGAGQPGPAGGWLRRRSLAPLPPELRLYAQVCSQVSIAQKHSAPLCQLASCWRHLCHDRQLCALQQQM